MNGVGDQPAYLTHDRVKRGHTEEGRWGGLTSPQLNDRVWGGAYLAHDIVRRGTEAGPGERG